MMYYKNPSDSKKEKKVARELDQLRSRLDSLRTHKQDLSSRHSNFKKISTHNPDKRFSPKLKLSNNIPNEINLTKPHSRHFSLKKDPQSQQISLKDIMKNPKLEKVFKEDIKINIEEPKQVPGEKQKNDLNFTGLKDLFNLSGIKHSNKHKQELESEISVLKQELSKYKDLYEREKQKYESIKTELLNIREQLYKNIQKSEGNIENDLPKLITKNRELYEQTLNQSDTLFENKLQIKELTYQRDQIRGQLKEANDKIDELPEARKHVLILLNFIQDIKTGLKSKLDLNADYTNKNLYKEELTKLLKNLSIKGKAYEDFKEAIKKSDYLKTLITQ